MQGGTFFLQLLPSIECRPLQKKARPILKNAWMDVMGRSHSRRQRSACSPITCVWALPEGDADYSTRWKHIKRYFTREYQKNYGGSDIPDESRVNGK